MNQAVAQVAGESSRTQGVPGTLDVDIGTAVERIDSWIDGAVRMLPNIVIALALILLFYGLGTLLRRLIHRQARARSTTLRECSRARRLADRYELRPMGTVGLLLMAKRDGVVEKRRPELDALKADGMYVRQELLDASLADAVLADAGE